MTTKHKKYVYVEMGKSYVKLRVFKSRDEKDPNRYIPLKRIKGIKRNFSVMKLEDLPVEVRDKINTI
ncbi:hypothetical protein HS7_20880 [Sulfolobales archaeon HS-7]|nr:hypothetical protein HS7_20880 [Sulfolobales archaeon HS-7]